MEDKNNNTVNVDVDADADKSTIGMRLLSVLIPLVGIVYYITKHTEKPKSSKDYLICAIVGFVVYMIWLVL